MSESKFVYYALFFGSAAIRAVNAISATSFLLRPKFVKQRPSLFQIKRVEAFSEPAVDWGE